nr:hypothetical protein [Tanacetum cinerariifolium]
MSTQQDIYAAGSESRPLILNKENYVSWSSRLLRRMIPEPGDANREVTATETFHVQSENFIKPKEQADCTTGPYAGQNAGNPAGYNNVIGNQVIQNDVQNPRVQNFGDQNGLIGVQGNGNQNQIGNGNLVAARAEGNATRQNGNQIRCYNYRGVGHYARNYTVRPKRRDAAYLQTQLLIAQKEEAGIQLQAEEYDLMAVAADLDEIEEVNANCILMANLQQASTSSTQTDSTPVYDSDGSAEVHENCDENCDDNEIFNMFTQDEQYTELGLSR